MIGDVTAGIVRLKVVNFEGRQKGDVSAFSGSMCMDQVARPAEKFQKLNEDVRSGGIIVSKYHLRVNRVGRKADRNVRSGKQVECVQSAVSAYVDGCLRTTLCFVRSDYIASGCLRHCAGLSSGYIQAMGEVVDSDCTAIRHDSDNASGTSHLHELSGKLAADH
jgi:hypothetical protein